MKIRKANLQDTRAIVDVIAPFVDAVISSEEGRQRFQPEMIQTIFERPDIHYFVTEIDHQVIGVVAYMEPAHFMHFFLNQVYQGQGYGRRQMWHFLESEIRRQGHSIITVKSSLYALDIYKRFGFVETGQYTEEHGIRFIPMRKDYRDF
ncbi:GNAT family N-acetyltransferase [Acinetobacter lwoffii]|uniref:GNAT family N-acetyltransferase n=1 Tax=Acinetobacter lwoffii TaxID=28090 RepID=A0AAW8AVI9_ACILW|nr:GNAT family N-acetyltransferase [Acinetobacter lwoffii]MCO8085827.1 GNAT family N-acetyltransferase [Acinetobacter lwoffii]MCU4614118.1 GNAT family N-acetyltransferase [Acinetobacter lwoffii]MDP1316268.1 GNAT family N-acetyltransferase [Acinetobacter lwoffii]MDP1370144.1 GNAT family N-acetyltransferase [Acinetobacter lwoffii]MDP1389579.1 GNAT family N-acetyltransferase [Acinetobacter lwoffii]